jgi:hypothetical protein
VGVEARCGAGDLIVLCGEALELMSAGRFGAAPHRVASAARPRLSVVFELRVQQPTLQQPRHAAPTAAAATAPPQASGAAAAAAAAGDELEQGRQYVAAFVAARRRAGVSASAVLGEFHVPHDSWPDEPEATPLAELATLVWCWVRACTDTADEQAAAAEALASAEYVQVTPSFADSTGRFVDVRLRRDAPVEPAAADGAGACAAPSKRARCATT